jgi:hypothetical protein
METKAIEEIKKLIMDAEKEGNVVVWTIEGLASMPLSEIIKQPTEGLLYDLNRDKATIWTLMKDDKWVNDYACALVITALKSRLAEGENIIAAIEHSGHDHDEAVCPCCNSEIGEPHTKDCPIHKFLEAK